MRLTEYLAQKQISDAVFSEQIGVSRQALHRYKAGERTPKPSVMRKIVQATGGEVAPNDFFVAEAVE